VAQVEGDGGSEAGVYSAGFRVGGYGFRDTHGTDSDQWDDCRMNGLGVYAQRTMSRHLFAEAALDTYFAANPTQVEGAEPAMDRVSGIVSIAGGARIPFRWASPFVMLGTGVELTRVRMVGHDESSGAYAMGFFGVGVDVHPTPKLSLGAAIRVNTMKHFEHDDIVVDHAEAKSVYDLASQGQFFARYSF
jgi:hypothetical protein